MEKCSTGVTMRFFTMYSVIKSWWFGKHHLNITGVVVRSKYENWLMIISGQSSSWQKHVLCHNSRVFGPRTNPMSCWPKMPLQYNIQITFITQTEICGKREHICHLKKNHGHSSHSYLIWSFITVLTSVTKDISYPIPLLPFYFWRRRPVMYSLSFLGSPSVVLDCIQTAKY